AVEGAVVQARQVSTGKTRTARTNASGKFNLAGTPAGDYQIKISNASENIVSNLTLEVRDRAVLSAFLRHQPAGTAVVAINESEGTDTDFAVLDTNGFAGVGGGVGAFRAGGVMGGMLEDMRVANRKQAAFDG